MACARASANPVCLLQTIRNVVGQPIFNFTDSRIALYTGKTSSSAFAQHYQQTSQASAVEAFDSGKPPLDLYLQRQPTLRVEVSFNFLPFSSLACSNIINPPRLTSPLNPHLPCSL